MPSATGWASRVLARPVPAPTASMFRTGPALTSRHGSFQNETTPSLIMIEYAPQAVVGGLLWMNNVPGLSPPTGR
jgi:hypothetical protein